MPRKFKQPLMIRYVLMIGLGLAVTACTPRVANRGNNPDAENLAEIKAGESNRQDVVEIIGAPTLTSSFDSKEWYYVSQRTEREAWFKPDIKERKVIMIRFDDGGVVESMETKTLADGYQVDPVGRITPTAGNEITFLGQIFGNLGKFGGAGKK